MFNDVGLTCCKCIKIINDKKINKKLLVKLIKPCGFEAYKEGLLRCEGLEEEATLVGLEERLTSFLGESAFVFC